MHSTRFLSSCIIHDDIHCLLKHTTILLPKQISLSIFNDIAYWGINKTTDEHDMNNEQVGETLQLV